MTTVREALHLRAIEQNLRRTTVLSYERLLNRLGALDMHGSQVTREWALTALWDIENPNTRRSAVIALRAVCGLDIKVPKAIPRRYDLPDEDTLRLALMTSPHETRGLLMMYGALRIGEACAVTGKDVVGDRVRVDKQVIQSHRKGEPAECRIAPVKASEADVVVPLWLAARTEGLTQTVKPDAVRESLRRAGRKVGMNLNPHLLRHWSATTLLERGVPLMVVSKHLRHSDVATTLRSYADHNSERYVHDAFG